MDQKEEIKLQEEQIKEEYYKLAKEDESETNQQEEAVEKEKFDNLEAIKEEEKVIQVCQDKELPSVVEGKSHENAAETGGENQLEATPPPVQAAAIVLEESQKGSSRKLSQGSKLGPRLKTTVPQPFCLATEKRMTRDRRSVDLSSITDQRRLPKETRGLVELKDSQPKLTKSVSLIKIKSRSLPGPGFGETSKLKNTNSVNAAAKTSSKMKVSNTESGEKKIENINLRNKSKIVVNDEEVESRHSHVGTAKKQQGEDKDKAQFRKSSTLKAPPLAKFYHRKDSLYTPPANKNPPTGPKTPAPAQKSQCMPNGDKLKLEEKSKATVSSKRITSSGAKETIAKLFESTKRTLNIGSKETVKDVVPSA